MILVICMLALVLVCGVSSGIGDTYSSTFCLSVKSLPCNIKARLRNLFNEAKILNHLSIGTSHRRVRSKCGLEHCEPWEHQFLDTDSA